MEIPLHQEHNHPIYTCVSCHVAFLDAEEQRIHYKSDWHRYNLKRKVAGMPPVTLNDFNQRLKLQQQKTAEEEQLANFTAHCEACNKNFSTENSYQNHIQSKKHKELEAKYAAGPKRVKKSTASASSSSADVSAAPSSTTTSDNMVLDGQTPQAVEATTEETDEMDEVDRKIEQAVHLTLEQCLFCLHSSATFQENMEHMTKHHSFFIPDIEYLIDLEGLVSYLGEKISIGNICIYCNERSKYFQSLESVRRHMVDKGHCKIFYEGDADLEFAEFYDFRPSYPDYDPSNLGTEDEQVVDDTPQFDQDNYQLVLSSGAKLGHRSMKLYYKQKFRPDQDRNSVIINRLMSQYKLLGWHNQPVDAQREERRRTRDAKKGALDLGVKANKLQHHFREQVIY